jgi:hypothetical protein
MKTTLKLLLGLLACIFTIGPFYLLFILSDILWFFIGLLNIISVFTIGGIVSFVLDLDI